MNLHEIESDEKKENTIRSLLGLFEGLASKQCDYNKSSWQGKTTFDVVTSVMIEDLLAVTKFSLLDLIEQIKIPATAAVLLQQIVHSLIGHARSFDMQRASHDEVQSEGPEQKKARVKRGEYRLWFVYNEE